MRLYLPICFKTLIENSLKILYKMNYLKYYTILIVIAICSLVTNQLMAAPIVKIISDKSLTLCAGDSVQLTADICTGRSTLYFSGIKMIAP